MQAVRISPRMVQSLRGKDIPEDGTPYHPLHIHLQVSVSVSESQNLSSEISKEEISDQQFFF
jgi:hypothetical protein